MWKTELAMTGCRSKEGQAAKELFTSDDGISVLEEKQLEELLKWGLLMGVSSLKGLLHEQGLPAGQLWQCTVQTGIFCRLTMAVVRREIDRRWQLCQAPGAKTIYSWSGCLGRTKHM